MLDGFFTESDIKGESFVTQRYEPKDDFTQNYVEDLAGELGLVTAGTRETSKKKLIRCLSDVLVAAYSAPSGLICWPMDANRYLTGGPYSRDIAVQVREALAPYLTVVQTHTRGVSRVYRIDKTIAPSGIRFREHDCIPLIEVRESKPNIYTKYGKPKGARVPLHHFTGRYEHLYEEMLKINRAMGQHPLQGPEGEEWCRVVRVFNDRRLDRGGRLYSRFQTLKSDYRLKCTIDGEPVGEIDVKASFLFLCAVEAGCAHTLSADPYQQIAFVQREPRLRGLAKRLVMRLLSKPELPQKFPKGDNKGGQVIPLREEYSLPKDAKVGTYVEDIYRAFPFLKLLETNAGNLMFCESNLILKTMIRLLDEDPSLVTYPVHDCLICKIKDKDKVAETLQDVMFETLGAEPSLDFEYGDPKQEESIPRKRMNTEGTNNLLSWLQDGDIILIDEEDS